MSRIIVTVRFAEEEILRVARSIVRRMAGKRTWRRAYVVPEHIFEELANAVGDLDSSIQNERNIENVRALAREEIAAAKAKK